MDQHSIPPVRQADPLIPGGGGAAWIAVLTLVFLGSADWLPVTDSCGVVGNSMLPTFRSGDLLLVDRWAYRHREPDRGEVVVASHHGEWVIKAGGRAPGKPWRCTKDA